MVLDLNFLSKYMAKQNTKLAYHPVIQLFILKDCLLFAQHTCTRFMDTCFSEHWIHSTQCLKETSISFVYLDNRELCKTLQHVPLWCERSSVVSITEKRSVGGNVSTHLCVALRKSNQAHPSTFPLCQICFQSVVLAGQDTPLLMWSVDRLPLASL